MNLTPRQETELIVRHEQIMNTPKEVLEVLFIDLLRDNFELQNRLNEMCDRAEKQMLAVEYTLEEYFGND